jgi:hypothetical protein
VAALRRSLLEAVTEDDGAAAKAGVMTATPPRSEPALVDGQLLGRLLRGETPAALAGRDVDTTRHRYGRISRRRVR